MQVDDCKVDNKTSKWHQVEVQLGTLSLLEGQSDIQHAGQTSKTDSRSHQWSQRSKVTFHSIPESKRIGSRSTFFVPPSFTLRKRRASLDWFTLSRDVQSGRGENDLLGLDVAQLWVLPHPRLGEGDWGNEAIAGKRATSWRLKT